MNRALVLSLIALSFTACDAPATTEEVTGTSGAAWRWSPDVLVNFDVLNSGGFFSTSTPVADGTEVDTLYTGYGVTFSCVGSGCASPHAYARWVSDGTNGVSVFGLPFFSLFDERWGTIRATFASPRTWASVDAHAVLPPEWLSTPLARPWMKAYGVNNNLLGTVYYPSWGAPGWGNWQGLLFNAGSASIKYIEFSSQYLGPNPPPVYGEFDNVLFNADPLQPIAIPKPPFIPKVIVW